MTQSRNPTTDGPALGVVFRPDSPPEDLRAAVTAAEAAGIAELWLWEDCFREGGLTTSAMALAWSGRLRIGIGLLPVPLRNPALAAMEIATLARAFPGRFIPALGHGVLDWMGQVGARAESPMALLREHTAAVRALLHGETLDTAGRYVTLSQVALDWPPAQVPPVIVGARGPKTVALGGEVGDGVLLDTVTDPDVVRAGARTAGQAADAAGRPAPQIIVFTEIDPRENDPAGRTRALIDDFVAAGAHSVILQAPGDAPDPRPLIDVLGEVS